MLRERMARGGARYKTRTRDGSPSSHMPYLHGRKRGSCAQRQTRGLARDLRDGTALFMVHRAGRGTIDAIATDHAPHAAREKETDLKHSAMGVVGLETSFAACYTRLVVQGRVDLSSLVRLMSLNPRRILGLPGFESGGIAEGDPAMLTLVDLNETRNVDPATFHGHGRATPFAGMELQGWPKRTICQIR